MTTASPALTPLDSRIASNMAGDGLPMTCGTIAVAVASAATIEPAPGRKPSAVG